MATQLRGAIFVVTAFVVFGSQPAQAGCPLPEQHREFKRALQATLNCAAKRLRLGADVSCQPEAPPPCGAEEFDRIVELLGGALPQAAAASSQRHCQATAYRAAREFLAKRIRQRRDGQRQQRLGQWAHRIEQKCTLLPTETVNGPLPHFGGRCASVADEATGFLLGDRLARCLRPALEDAVNSLLELPPVAPNVVLIVTDDQRADSVDVMPSVQDIASQGVSFANAFTTTPICAPARAGILTGQYATTNGVIANGIPDGQGGHSNGALALDESSTLATWFQAAGYRTGHFGKYLNGYSQLSPGIPQGWDDWRTFVHEANNFVDYLMNENGQIRSYGNSVQDYSTDVIAGQALEFMHSNADRPFLLMLNPFAPHGPSTVAARHIGALASLPLWRPPSWAENVSDKPAWLRLFAVNDATLLAHDAEIQKQRESLLAVDEAVAALDAELEHLGLSDNTIFVFTSDHGLAWGEHRWIYKQVPYEEGIRIPLAIRYPVRLAENDVRSEFALNVDIAPTLADMAGVSMTHEVDGRSLLDAIDGAGDWRQEVLVQHFTAGFVVPPWDLLRTERYKYVRHVNNFAELYDLAEDPYELDNIAQVPASAAIVADLSARLDELLAP